MTTTPLTINPLSAQIGINGTVTLKASGGSGNYSWTTSTPPSGGTNPVYPPLSEGATCKITGQCFGAVTVIVTDTSSPPLTATATISVGSVTIAGPDGNYYRCYPSGATEQLTSAQASGAFSALNPSTSKVVNLFGDANSGEIYYVSPLQDPSTPTPITEPQAVTCYLLNLTSFTGQ